MKQPKVKAAAIGIIGAASGIILAMAVVSMTDKPKLDIGERYRAECISIYRVSLQEHKEFAQEVKSNRITMGELISDCILNRSGANGYGHE